MMILVKPSFEVMEVTENPLGVIEAAGRTCYKSEEKITEGSANKFCEMIMKRGHLSVIEHASMTVRFICDRGVTHELVRHRLAAYSQESTRYCNYSRDKYGQQITFVIPPWCEGVIPGTYRTGLDFPSIKSTGVAAHGWLQWTLMAEDMYMRMISQGWKPEQARSVLPNSLKTEIVMTANFREWRHVFRLRCSKTAHPQMRELMTPLWKYCAEEWPVLFSDCKED